MATQTIFQAGNSPVVSIPKDLFKKLNLKIGQTVTVSKLKDSNDLIIHTSPQTEDKKTPVTKEFREWMNKFVDDEKELLVELSHR